MELHLQVKPDEVRRGAKRTCVRNDACKDRGGHSQPCGIEIGSLNVLEQSGEKLKKELRIEIMESNSTETFYLFYKEVQK